MIIYLVSDQNIMNAILNVNAFFGPDCIYYLWKVNVIEGVPNV